MPIHGLTDKQSTFLETFILVPKFGFKKKAKQRLNDATREFGRFNVNHDAVKRRIDALEDPVHKQLLHGQLAKAEGLIGTDPKNLNFQAAAEHLANVSKAVSDVAAQKEAREKFAIAQARMVAVDAAIALDNKDDIDIVWAFVQDRFQRGIKSNNQNDLDGSVKAMDQLFALIKAGREDITGDGQQARRDLRDVAIALQELEETADTVFTVADVPPSVARLFDKVRTAVDDGAKADLGALPGAARAAETALLLARTGSGKMIADREAWEKEDARFTKRHDVMMAHPLASDAAFVKPKFKTVSDAYKAATDQAQGHDYVRAVADLAPVFATLATALGFADNYAAFLAALEKRRALLGELPSPGSRGLDQVKDAIRAANDLLVDAELARDALTMDVASQKLTDIVRAVDETKLLISYEDSFDKLHADMTQDLTNLNGWDAKIKALVAADLASLKQRLDDAKAEADNGEIARAAEMLANYSGFISELVARMRLIAEYREAKAAFKIRLSETEALDGDKGRFAIEDYYQALLRDKARMDQYEASGEFQMAIKLARQLESAHAGKVDIATNYGAPCVVLRKEINVIITTLEAGAPGLAQALGTIAMAKTLMADAVSAGRDGDWFGANRLLEEAKATIESAELIADNAGILDAMQDTAILDAIAADFDAAYGEFTKVYTVVADLDDDDTFKPLLDAAKTIADTAQGFATAAPPDNAQARAALDNATTACKDVLAQISAKGYYDSVAQTVKSVLDILAKDNKDKCVQPEIDRVKALQKSAFDMVKAPGLDFKAATDEMGKAYAAGRTGLHVCNYYAGTYKIDQKALIKGLKALQDKKIAPGLTAEIQRLSDIIDAHGVEFVARNMQNADKKAIEGINLIGPYKKLGQSFLETKKFYKQRITDHVGPEMSHGTLTDQIREINDQIRAIDAKMDDHAYETAGWMVRDCGFLIDALKKAAKDHDTWAPVKKAARDALQGLQDRDDVANGPGHARITELEAIHDSAMQKEGRGNFSGATKRLTGFADLCKAVVPKLDKYDIYVAARDTAQREIGRVSNLGTAAIAPLFTRIEGKRDNALRMGVAFDFDTAIVLFTELLADCATADSVIASQAEFSDVMSTIKEIKKDDTDDLRLSISAARATFGQLGAKPAALFVKAPLRAVSDKIDQAQALVDSDFDQALKLLSQAVDTCAVLAGEMGRFDQFSDSAELARKLATDMQSKHPQGLFAKDDIADLVKQVDDRVAELRQDSTKRSAMRDAIEIVITSCRDLAKILDTHHVWHLESRQIEAELSILEKNENRHQIRADITEIRSKLDSAAAKADTRDHAGAMQDLARARERISMAGLRLKVSVNEAPTKDELKAILDAPNGPALLDDIINGLDASAQRKVMNAAFEARFGCKLDLFASPEKYEGGKQDKKLERAAPNIKRFYDLMSKAPPSSTLDNDSMLIFSHVGEEATGSYFSGTTKEVAMREGEASESGIYGVGLEHELGVDPALLNLEDGEPISFFSWNTLHEVGHAVDDKLGYMKAKGKALAGWEVYGGNATPVADAIAAEFDFSSKYIAEFISGGPGSAPPVPEPVGCTPEEWERRRVECTVWVNRIRHGQSPWANDNIAKLATAKDGYVYHESYAGDWCRYLYSARAKGVSAYQFRAPGEWFSELYAAHQMKKLKAAHPHYSELENL